MRSKPNPLTVKAMGKPTSRKSTVTFAQPEQHHGRRHSAKGSLPQQPSLSRTQRLRNFLLRLPVAVSLIYFLFLVCVGIIINVSTRIVTGKAVFETWRDTHALQVQSVSLRIDAIANRMRNITVTAAAFYADSPNPVESNKTLTMLCATLDITDKKQRVRALALGSFAVSQYASCVHGDLTDPSPTNLTAIASDKGNFYGVSYINPATYTYYDPNIPKGITGQTWSMAYFIESFKPRYSIFKQLDLLAEGAISSIDPRYCWGSAVNEPNYLSYIVPVASLGLSSNSRLTVYPTDFAQTRITGATLLDTLRQTNDTGYMRAMVLVNRSLAFDDPQVLSLNWNQELVLNPSFVSFSTNNTTYLTVSQISDPLIKEAAKRVDFKALQREGYKKTQYFSYRGAPAAITAYVYTNANGLTLPVVVVSPQRDVSGPYMLINNISTGIVAVAVVLMTGLCYFAMDRYLARPLRRLTTAMLASLRRGVRQPVRADPCDVVQLTETRELTQAYNAAMAQLRLVDEFVPNRDAFRTIGRFMAGDGTDYHRDDPGLWRQHLTILTIHIRRFPEKQGTRGVAQSPPSTLSPPPAAAAAAGASVAEGAASEEMTGKSYGPFVAKEDLEAFVAAVLRLNDEHGGYVHLLTPDTCVLYFGTAMYKEHLTGATAAQDNDEQASASPTSPNERVLSRRMQRIVSQDARDSLAFGFALLHWADTLKARQRLPDLRLLADTDLFTCGQHKAPGSGQTMAVVLGRDVDRSLGHIPAKIGVRLAMTEETADFVRTHASGSGVVGGIRQLPVEAMRTGRVGLDADVIILYEALPGAAAGDIAWQRYSKCCCEGFALMLRGDYAAALAVLKGVMDIANLEPGLIPSRFRREAARSAATGGATSTQVERLMCECERRVATHWTQGFYRTPIRPLGLDVVLPTEAQKQRMFPRGPGGGSAEANNAAVSTISGAASPTLHQGPGLVEKRRGRYGLTVKNPQVHASPARIVTTIPGTTQRTIYSAAPATLQDNWGHEWKLAKATYKDTTAEMHKRSFTLINATGTMASDCFYLYHEVPPIVSTALRNVPDGPLDTATRTAVPFWLPSSAQREAVHKLFGPCLRLRHANVLACLGYTIAYEGGVAALYEYSPGIHLHELRQQFPSDRCRSTVTRLGCSIIKGLMFLHLNGIVHGELRPECVLVCSDGLCRLKGFFTNYELAHRVLCIPRTCYVSPEVAAGQPPSPASDVFGYGLVMLELITKKPPWAWAPVSGEGPQRSELQLKALMAAGGEVFSELVASRLVVPAVDNLDGLPSSGSFSTASAYVIRRCLEWTAPDRITLREALNGTIRAGKVKRARLAKRHALLHFGDSDEDDENTEDDEDGSDNALIQIIF